MDRLERIATDNLKEEEKSFIDELLRSPIQTLIGAPSRKKSDPPQSRSHDDVIEFRRAFLKEIAYSEQGNREVDESILLEGSSLEEKKPVDPSVSKLFAKCMENERKILFLETEVAGAQVATNCLVERMQSLIEDQKEERDKCQVYIDRQRDEVASLKDEWVRVDSELTHQRGLKRVF